MKAQQSGRTFTVLLVLWGFFGAPAFAADWSLKVISIEFNGSKVRQATLQINAQSREVKEGERFADDTVIAAPARTTLMLESSNSNRLRLLPGSRLRVLAGSQMGEEFGQEDGQSFFDVKRALNFFNVRHGRFQAIVKGTRYSVTVIPEKEITFAVELGSVRIEREGKLRIDEGGKERTITVSETLKAGESRSFRLDIDEYLAYFKHYGEAEAYYRKNLEADRLSGDPERIEIGLNQMGIALDTLSKYRESISYFDELRQSVIKRHPGGVHADIATSLHNLGVAYTDLSGTANLERAIGYYDESLKIYRQLYPGGVHANIANNLNNLGLAYARLGGTGNLERAIGYHEESLKIRRQLYPGGVHADIAGSLNNLGAAYWTLGGTDNLQRAIGYWEESLNITRQIYPGGVQADIAKSLNNLGVAYRGLGGTANLERAIGYYEESLKILRHIYPDGVHSDIAQSFGNLSYTRIFVGQYTEALRDAREALQIAPDKLWIRTNEAHALLLMDREAEALAIYTLCRDQPVQASQTFREGVLDDFAALRKAGVDHPGMAKVEALYGQPAATPDRAKP